MHVRVGFSLKGHRNTLPNTTNIYVGLFRRRLAEKKSLILSSVRLNGAIKNIPGPVAASWEGDLRLPWGEVSKPRRWKPALHVDELETTVKTSAKPAICASVAGERDEPNVCTHYKVLW